MQIYEIKMILFETRTIKAKNYKQALGIAQEYFAGSDPETEIYRIDKKGKRHWIWVK